MQLINLQVEFPVEAFRIQTFCVREFSNSFLVCAKPRSYFSSGSGGTPPLSNKKEKTPPLLPFRRRPYKENKTKLKMSENWQNQEKGKNMGKRQTRPKWVFESIFKRFSDKQVKKFIQFLLSPWPKKWVRRFTRNLTAVPSLKNYLLQPPSPTYCEL